MIKKIKIYKSWIVNCFYNQAVATSRWSTKKRQKNESA